nr:E3 ubiquitin-protein ligase At1g63170-like [Tanacetum cinerariifolium]
MSPIGAGELAAPWIISLVQKLDTLQSGVSTTNAARILGIAPAMAKEHLLAAESKDNDLLRELPFIYFFRIECIDKWLKINTSFQLCKFKKGQDIDATTNIMVDDLLMCGREG